jgi:hypothetical protein
VRRALTLALATAGALVPVSPAQAGYFLGQPADTGNIVSLGGVSLSRDGAGVVGYIKQEAGVNHVFAADLVTGNPQPPRRLDTGQLTASSNMQISSAKDGRAVAVWLNGGSLYAAVRQRNAPNWSAPHVVYARPLTGPSATAPSLQMGPSGHAYVAFEAGGNVRAAYLRRGAGSFQLHAQAFDVDASRTASQIDLATAADGAAIVAWVEAGNVYTRRFVKGRVSSVTPQVDLPTVAGQPGGAADSPSVDFEDDSSYAWVVIRQATPTGPRMYARRLSGSQYGEPWMLDISARPAGTPDIDVSGRGRGVFAAGVAGSNAVLGGAINRFNRWIVRGPIVPRNTATPLPDAAISEDGRGTVAFHSRDAGGQPSVVGSYFNARVFEGPATLNRPELGPVDPTAGLDASGDLFGNQAVAWVQGTGANRRVLVGVYDKEPRGLGNRENFREWTHRRTYKLRWSDTEDVWGAIRYRIEIDGRPVATTTGTRYTLRNVRDGQHVLNIVTLDSRNQETVGPDRFINVDRRAPTGRITSRTSRRGRPANVFLTARDGRETLDGSGVYRATVRWGDGTGRSLNVPRIGVIDGARMFHRYRRRGNFRIRVVLEDKAGNRRAIRGRVRVR